MRDINRRWGGEVDRHYEVSVAVDVKTTCVPFIVYIDSKNLIKKKSKKKRSRFRTQGVPGVPVVMLACSPKGPPLQPPEPDGRWSNNCSGGRDKDS